MKTYRTIKLVLQDDDANVLLLRRSKTHPTQALQMDLPGGIIDGEEQPVEALLRELDEEIGIKLEPGQLKLVFAAAEIRDVEGEGQNAVRLVYAATIPGSKSEITLSWEHDQYEWRPIERAEQELQDGNYKKRALKYLITNKILQDL